MRESHSEKNHLIQDSYESNLVSFPSHYTAFRPRAPCSCCSWDHPQPHRGYGHRCTAGVNRDTAVSRHGQNAMTTERQPPAVLDVRAMCWLVRWHNGQYPSSPFGRASQDMVARCITPTCTLQHCLACRLCCGFNFLHRQFSTSILESQS